MTETERIVPLAVIEDEARACGYALDAKSLLIGYVIGREGRLQDEKQLRWLTRLIAEEKVPPGTDVMTERDG